MQQIADNALERGLEALDRRQGWRGPLGVMPQGADIDKVLAAQTAKLRPNHFAALVTKVGPRSAEIYVNGRNAIIPFELAFWAYPPRRDNGIRPPPLRDLRKALSKDDIVTVSYTHLRAHETDSYLVCRLLLEKSFTRMVGGCPRFDL